MKKLIFLFCSICLFITSSLWASGLSGIIIAGGGGTISSVPAAPTGVSATAGNTQNTVTWSASSGSTSCNLYWKSGSSMSGNCTGNGTKVTGVTSPDVITSLTNGTTYYYMLTCQNAAGESACSSEVSGTPNVTVTVPGAPTSVAATAGNTQNTITWSAPSSGGTPTSYNLYWSTTDMGSTCSSGAKVTGVSSPNIITSLTNGTKYYYMLTAVNSAGEGACSSEVNATPIGIPVQQGGYSGTLTASSIGQTGATGGTDVIMQNYSLTASTITEAKIENYYANAQGAGSSASAWIRFKVWRLNGGIYTLIGTTPQIAMQTTTGLQTYTFTGITCQTGDLIGFSTNADGTGSPDCGAVDTLNSGSGTWYSENGNITSGTLTQSGMTSHTTYQNMQIQFWGD